MRNFTFAFLCFFTFLSGSNCLLAENDRERALLKYNLNDLDASVEMPPSQVSAGVAKEKDGDKSGAVDLISRLLKHAGKKEQKVLKQLLEFGEKNKLIDLEKIEKKLSRVNVGALVNLYRNLKAVKLRKFDIGRLEEIKNTLIEIDGNLRQLKDSPKEFGDLSFFAGMTRDQLANIAQTPQEKASLRENALENYRQSILNLADKPDQGSKEKVEDAKERITSLESSFANLVPIAAKMGSGKVFITSDYGTRIHPVKKTRRFHSGVDLAGWKCKGWKVMTIGPGRVVKSGWETGYGYVVVVSHEVEGRQYYSRYAHLLKNGRLKNGALVKAKDVVGICNNSGVSTGSHLHFEVRENSYSGKSLDPKKFLPAIPMLK